MGNQAESVAFLSHSKKIVIARTDHSQKIGEQKVSPTKAFARFLANVPARGKIKITLDSFIFLTGAVEPRRRAEPV
jgi:hypothetical protein